MSTDSSGSRRFEKHVRIKATDDDEQVSTGLVLTPNELDGQLDFFDTDGVRAMYASDPDDGVMHAVFPEDDATLLRNEVLEEDEVIDSHQFDAGDWVIRRQYTNPDRWALVKSNVLNGYSIGGQVTETIEYDSVGDLPDSVTIPASVDPGSVPQKYHPPTQILDGSVDEISDVDVPAVPSATHAVVKDAGLAKDIFSDVEGREEFIALMIARGATEDGADKLYDYMDGVADAEKATLTPPTDEMSHQTDDDSNDLSDVDDATLGKKLKQLFFGKSETGATDTDDGDAVPELSTTRTAKALYVAKEGRTLNAENREALMAAHDAIETALATDMEFRTNRFTDDPDVDFSVDDYAAKAADVEKDLTDAQGLLVGQAVQQFVDAQGDADVGVLEEWAWNMGEEMDADLRTALDIALDDYFESTHPHSQSVLDSFVPWVAGQVEVSLPESMKALTSDESAESDSDTTASMSTDDTTTDDDSDSTKDAPEWAKALIERVDDLDEKVDDIEDGEDAEKSIEDAPEWAHDLSEKVEDLGERVDAVSKATAGTQQAGGSEETMNEDDLSTTERQKRELFGLSGGDA
jgi:hypothetical protein